MPLSISMAFVVLVVSTIRLPKINATADKDIFLSSYNSNPYEVVRNFNEQLETFANLQQPTRKDVDEAVQIATARRPVMKEIIIKDPEASLLELVIPFSLRHNLPDSVAMLLEQQIDAYGTFFRTDCHRKFDLLKKSYESHQEMSGSWLEVGEEGQFFNPTLHGRRIAQRPKARISVHGLAIDEALAWSEEPLRVLGADEKKEKYGYDDDVLVALVGDEIVEFDTPQDLEILRNQLITVEDLLDPYLTRDDLVEEIGGVYDRLYLTGVKNILWVPVDFSEYPGSRFTRSADTDYTIAQADEWLQESSRGKASLNVVYFPGGILRLLPGAISYAQPMNGLLIGRVYEALEAYDRAHGASGRWLASSWDRLAIVIDDIPDVPGGAAIQRGAFTNLPTMVFYGLINRFYMQHELGHAFVMGHSDYAQPQTNDLSGPYTSSFGMFWDYMGQGFGDQRSHPNGLFKSNAYWFENTELVDATYGGRIALFAHDDAPPDIPHGIVIRTDGDAREYWVDMRRLWPEETALDAGVQIHFWEKRTPTERFPVIVQAIGRQSFALIQSSPFQEGDVFEDRSRGLRISIGRIGEDPFRHGVMTADVEVVRFSP